MTAAIQAFSEKISQKDISPKSVLWIIGNMNELGEYAPLAHQTLGQNLSEVGADNIVFIGHYYQDFKKGFEKNRGKGKELPQIKNLQIQIILKKLLEKIPEFI